MCAEIFLLQRTQAFVVTSILFHISSKDKLLLKISFSLYNVKGFICVCQFQDRNFINLCFILG